jgi:hypothetical protein
VPQGLDETIQEERAKKYWWRSDPSEIYWIEIRHVPGTGSELRCPVADTIGKPNPWYDLLDAVRPGDVIYHWHAQEHRFVGWSQVEAPVHIVADERIVPLAGFTPLDHVVNRETLLEKGDEIRRVCDELSSRLGNRPGYLPFQFRADGLRLMSNYFVKLPKALLTILFEAPSNGGHESSSESVAPATMGQTNPRTTISRLHMTYLQPFAPKADGEYRANIAPRTERRSRSHETLVNAFALRLQDVGLEVQRNQAIDLAVREPFIIIEAKILPDGAIHNEIRQAVGQLYEYRFFKCGRPDAQLMFLGSGALGREWIRYLEEDRGIVVAWWSGDRFQLSSRAAAVLELRTRAL